MSDNDIRAERASAMIATWAEITGDEPRLADILADLMHFADGQCLDFDSELSMATDFYGDEA